MNSENIAITVIDALVELHIPYMVVGSFSVNCYAIPRSTQDADFVVQVKPEQPRAIAERLGPAYHLDSQMSFETVTATTRYILTHRDSAFKIELFELSDDPHDQMRFERRVTGQVGGRSVFVPTPEDVIITKLRWSKQGRRAKDIEDVRGVLIVQTHEVLDWTYLRRWCGQHGTLELLQKLEAETATA
ncbi:MAG: nucleotidyl transferase AbiEii/AbiGii toxin family protein [Phycisphaerales bacterium]